MAALHLALALALGGATPPVEFDAAVTTEARVRTADPGDFSSVGTAEILLAPAVAAKARTKDAGIELRYTPRLTLIDPPGSHTVDVLHVAGLAADWEPGRGVRLRLEDGLSAGTTSISPLLVPGGVLGAGGVVIPPDRLPSLDNVAYLGSNNRLSLGFEVTRRLQAELGAGYFVSGGADASARLFLPQERGPRFDGALTWKSARIETVGLRLSVAHTDTSSGPTADIGEAVGVWTRGIDETSNIAIEAGTAAYHTNGVLPASATPGVPPPIDAPVPTWSASPVAAVTVRDALPGRDEKMQLIAQARFGPTIDPLLGGVLERADGSVGFDFNPVSRLRLHNAVSSGATVNGERGGYGQLESGATYTLSKQILVAAGARGGYFVTEENTGTVQAFQWVALLSATVTQAEVP